MLKRKIIGFIRKNTFYPRLISIYKRICEIKNGNRVVSRLFDMLNGIRVELYTNESIFRYCKKNKLIVSVCELEQEREVYSPIEYPSNKEAIIYRFKSPCIYYAIINNVKIWGDNDSISCDKYVLDDRYLYSFKEDVRFENRVCRYYNNKSSMIAVSNRKRVIEEGIYLLGEASNNWYHWLFDILGRIVYINQHEELKSVPLLVDDNIQYKPSFLRMLELNDDYRHPIIFIGRAKMYTVQKLHFFSRSTWSAVYYRNNVYNTERFIKAYLPIDSYKKHIMPLSTRIKTDENKNKKLFIVRPSTVSKRLVNEEEIATISKHYGFSLFEPSMYSIEEQARVFNCADYIIAGEGAALVNIMWCKKGCKLVCIIDGEWHDYNYSTIAYMCGVECVYLKADTLEKYTHRLSSITLENFLEKEGLSRLL